LNSDAAQLAFVANGGKVWAPYNGQPVNYKTFGRIVSTVKEECLGDHPTKHFKFEMVIFIFRFDIIFKMCCFVISIKIKKVCKFHIDFSSINVNLVHSFIAILISFGSLRSS